MKKYYILFLIFFVSVQLKAQLVSYEKIDSFTVEELEQRLINIGFSSFIQPKYGVDLYRVMYRTEFLDSTTLISGALAVPRNTVCKVPVINYAHGTSSFKPNVPSFSGAERNIVVFFASLGNAVCASDFIGLGASNIDIHPYVHAFSQAHSCLNMIRATRQLKEELDINMGNQLFSFGYSQGGHSSAATVKYAELVYPEEFKFTAAAPMSGPYNLHGEQFRFVNSGEEYATPGYLPYIFFSYQMMYGGLYNEVSDILKAPYDSLMPFLFSGHQVRIGQISAQATPVPTDMVVDSVQDLFETDPYHAFRFYLLDNDLLNWTPQTPMKLLYCEGDEQVIYRNSVVADSVWNYNGAPNVSSINHGDFSHADCIPFALLAGLDFFEGFYNNGVEILTDYNQNSNSLELSILNDDVENYNFSWSNGNNTALLENINPSQEYTVTATHKTNGCSATKKTSVQTAVSIKKISDQTIFAIYPNPSNLSLNLETELLDYEFEIFNSIGEKVMSKAISQYKMTFDISHFTKGVYFAQVKGTNIKEKLVVN